MNIPASVLREAEEFVLQHSSSNDPVVVEAVGLAVGMFVGYINAWSMEHNHENENTISISK